MERSDVHGHQRFGLRRLAAVDMHALSGTDRRRRVIVAEYLVGAVAGLAIGAFLLLAADDAVGTAIGIYAIGIGANYVAPACHALTMRSRERLEREVAGLDMAAELRYYNRMQFLVFVPFLFAGLALVGR